MLIYALMVLIYVNIGMFLAGLIGLETVANILFTVVFWPGVGAYKFGNAVNRWFF